MVAALLFLVGQTVWSFVVEGRRHAVDRLATTLVYATFVIAARPAGRGARHRGRQGLPGHRLGVPHDLHAQRQPARRGRRALHAIIGTLEQVGIAALIGVPSGSSPRSTSSSTAAGRLARASASSSTS